MQKDDKPETFGAFMPVGHVVASFASADDADAAIKQLLAHGFGDTDITRYTPEQMKAQADRDIAQASPLASIGQELNLIKAHRALAGKGYSFLVVNAPNSRRTKEVAQIVKDCRAERAQKYGRFTIEELIEDHDDLPQVFESPARGLDAQTPSGHEEERDQHRKVVVGQRPR